MRAIRKIQANGGIVTLTKEIESEIQFKNALKAQKE